MRCVPYALIVAAGVGYGWASQVPPELLGTSSGSVAPVSESAVGSAAVEPESEALRLVYEYRLPGTDQDMLDLLGSREEALGPSPWDVACGEDLHCEVSFNPRSALDVDPLYGFAVDLGAKTVTPFPETAARLLSSAVAQNDAG